MQICKVLSTHVTQHAAAHLFKLVAQGRKQGREGLVGAQTPDRVPGQGQRTKGCHAAQLRRQGRQIIVRQVQQGQVERAGSCREASQPARMHMQAWRTTGVRNLLGIQSAAAMVAAMVLSCHTNSKTFDSSYAAMPVIKERPPLQGPSDSLCVSRSLRSVLMAVCPYHANQAEHFTPMLAGDRGESPTCCHAGPACAERPGGKQIAAGARCRCSPAAAPLERCSRPIPPVEM
jgi:hypothetical protein